MASVRSLRARLGSNSGAELIEMALVLPLLLVIILGIFEFGFLFRELLVVTNAAREGARAGLLPGYEDDANVTARIQQYMDASGVNVTCGATGDCRVQASTVCVPGLGAPPCVGGAYQARSVTITLNHNYMFL